MKIKNGIHRDISMDDYNAETHRMRSSALKQFLISPNHYLHYINQENERKAHFDFGNAFEIALLQPDAWSNEVHIYDKEQICAEIGGARPTSTKKYKEWFAEQIAEAEDKYMIQRTGDESYETLRTMVKHCLDDELISALIKNIEYQITVAWEQDGVLCKARPDIAHVNKHVLVDVKTTTDASPSAFIRDCKKFDYPLQAALQYLGTIETGLMPQVDAYFYLVAEKQAPYNVQLYRLSQEDLNIAIQIVKRGLELYVAWMMSEDERSGYNYATQDKFGVIDISIPEYYYNQIIRS